jgi:hypothetical protein
MAVHPEKKVVDTRSRRPPATTPEARENQLISAAHDLAEKQIREGTASAQVITHFLKLGSSREKLEQHRIEQENMLTEVKIEAIKAQANIEALYKEALNAMSAYQGREPARSDDEFED